MMKTITTNRHMSDTNIFILRPKITLGGLILSDWKGFYFWLQTAACSTVSFIKYVELSSANKGRDSSCKFAANWIRTDGSTSTLVHFRESVWEYKIEDVLLALKMNKTKSPTHFDSVDWASSIRPRPFNTWNCETRWFIEVVESIGANKHRCVDHVVSNIYYVSLA